MLDYIGRTYLRYHSQSKILIYTLFRTNSKRLNKPTYNLIIK